MGNLQKITRSIASGVLSEIERTPEQGRKFDPQKHEIHAERTHLNYSLTNRGMSASDYLNKRLSEIKVMKRDDVKVLGQWVWTMPKDLDSEYQDEFFKQIYEFYAEKHGAENIAYAQVHLDESTPHLHIGIIPIVPNKKGVDRVCAKEVFSKLYLNTAHSDLQKHLEKTLGIEVNLLNGQTLGVEGIKEYKAAKDLSKSVQQLADQRDNLVQQIQLLKSEKKILEDTVDDLDERRLSLTADIEELEEKIEEQKGLLAKIKDAVIGHPNMFQMFLHWITRGKYTYEEELKQVKQYEQHLDELTRPKHRDYDDGPSL